MAAIALRLLPADGETAEQTQPPAPPLDGSALHLVERLRAWGSAARLSRPGDLDRACATIGEPGAALEAVQGAALLSALATGCRPPLTLHRAGAREASRDELWLVRLLERLATGDEGSARFLVARRVAPVARRRALFLARRIAESLGPEAAVA